MRTLPTTRPGPWSLRDGRWLIVLLAPLYVAVFFHFGAIGNPLRVAHIWGVSVMQPRFSDLYVIPAAVATQRGGGDPYVTNPYDPKQRTLNYPAIWLHLVGSDRSPTTIRNAALLMLAAGLVALLIFFGPLSRKRGFLVAVLACSPPVLLGAERANIDLLMLALVAGGLWLLRRTGTGSAWLGYAALIAAGFLKLFPLAAAVAVGRERGKRFYAAGLLAGAACLICLLVNAPHLSQIVANTQRGTLDSYGSHVLASWIAFVTPTLGWSVNATQLEPVCRIAALALLAFAIRVAIRGTLRDRSAPVEPRSVDGLRVGGAIYICTFLLGSNFDYRLVFLFLCVPALFELIDESSALRRWSIAALALIAGTLWANGCMLVALGIVQTFLSWALLFVLAVLLLRTQDRWPRSVASTPAATA